MGPAAFVRLWYDAGRWMYRGRRPGALARVLNRLSAMQFSAGLLVPHRAATLEVVGRSSGKVISFPIVVTDLEGDRFLVAMLGERANWVRNVRRADGRAVLRHRGREEVRLVEIPPEKRAPVLRRFLELAPGARPHLPVDQHASLVDFARIADDYPVFRIDPHPTEQEPRRP
jgi:hypothetical protein